MPRLKRWKIISRRRVEHGPAGGGRFRMTEACSRSDEHNRLVRSFKRQIFADRPQRSPLRAPSRHAGEPDAVRASVAAVKADRVPVFGPRPVHRPVARHLHAEVQRARPVRRHTQNQHVVGSRRKRLAPDFHAVERKRGCAQRALHIQFEQIIFRLTGFSRPLQEKVAQRLIAALAVRNSGQRLGCEHLRLTHLACIEQFAHARPVGQAIRVVPINKTAAPHGFFIELKPLPERTAKDHRPQPSIADRQRRIPIRRRVPVP